MGRLVEGLWDCPYCGRKGNKGGKRECEGCGKRRDDETTIYMPSEIQYVPEDEAKKINRNPDWLCQYCDSFNSDSDRVCSACGATRTSENLNYHEVKAERERKQREAKLAEGTGVTQESYNSNTLNDNWAERPDGIYGQSYDSDKNSAMEKFKTAIGNAARAVGDFFSEYWKHIAIIVAVLALVAGLVYIFIPKKDQVTITSFSWERSISIERYQTVNESDWSLPSGGRLHETRQEIYTYEQVLDHYETRSRQVAKERLVGYEDYVSGYRDLGDGYFEEIVSQRPVYETYYETEYYEEPIYRSEPVYRTKYYYEIDKWLYDRTLTSSGYGKEPYWEDTSALPDDERVSDKTEKYYINGINKKGKTTQISIPYGDWVNLKEDQTVKLKVSVFGEGTLIDE